MSELTISFVETLVQKHPGLRSIFGEHVSDNFGEVLPHLFFGDLTRYMVRRVLESGPEAEQELRPLLSDLDDAYADGGDEIRDLIGVSFLEHLPRPEEEGSAIRAWLGPELSAQLRVIG